jgi:hypothetical protein
LATLGGGDRLDRKLAIDRNASRSQHNAMTRTCALDNRGSLLAALAANAGQADFGRPRQPH